MASMICKYPASYLTIVFDTQPSGTWYCASVSHKAAIHAPSAADFQSLCKATAFPPSLVKQSNYVGFKWSHGSAGLDKAMHGIRLFTSGWFRPKYSGPAMAVLGGGGRSSPAALLASISALMRFSTWRWWIGPAISGDKHKRDPASAQTGEADPTWTGM